MTDDQRFTEALSPEKIEIMLLHKLNDLKQALGDNHEIAKTLWESGESEDRRAALWLVDPKRLSENEILAWSFDLSLSKDALLKNSFRMKFRSACE